MKGSNRHLGAMIALGMFIKGWSTRKCAVNFRDFTSSALQARRLYRFPGCQFSLGNLVSHFNPVKKGPPDLEQFSKGLFGKTETIFKGFALKLLLLQQTK